MGNGLIANTNPYSFYEVFPTKVVVFFLKRTATEEIKTNKKKTNLP